MRDFREFGISKHKVASSSGSIRSNKVSAPRKGMNNIAMAPLSIRKAEVDTMPATSQLSTLNHSAMRTSSAVHYTTLSSGNPGRYARGRNDQTSKDSETDTLIRLRVACRNHTCESESAMVSLNSVHGDRTATK